MWWIVTRIPQMRAEYHFVVVPDLGAVVQRLVLYGLQPRVSAEGMASQSQARAVDQAGGETYDSSHMV